MIVFGEKKEVMEVVDGKEHGKTYTYVYSNYTVDSRHQG
jgi:hypothetical protein